MERGLHQHLAWAGLSYTYIQTLPGVLKGATRTLGDLKRWPRAASTQSWTTQGGDPSPERGGAALRGHNASRDEAIIACQTEGGAMKTEAAPDQLLAPPGASILDLYLYDVFLHGVSL
ncbi:hypothetical protein CSUB01_11906 [Colletotrichum sublineola]|uniref:Uncharacterized protein n=1 Tax=Colletotrichum sublineola TaxID=1173701 RepID=A0A066XW85_COLSU|nr:hypothetical protein CSUB01_11906 [Colletotrichum sublineola]